MNRLHVRCALLCAGCAAAWTSYSRADQIDMSLDAASVPAELDRNDGSNGREPVDLLELPSGPNPPTLFFSVDRVAVGVPAGAVAADRAATGSAAPDIFSVQRGQSAALYASAGALGLRDNFFGDDIDGLQISAGSGINSNARFEYEVFWRNSPAIGGFGPADIIRRQTSTLFAASTQMGLQGTDGIDGLVLMDVTPDSSEPDGFRREPNGVLDSGLDRALFSLDPFSPTVLGGAAKPGDVLLTRFDSVFSPLLDSAELGLLPSDNVNALSLVPEPAALPLFILLSLMLRQVRR